MATKIKLSNKPNMILPFVCGENSFTVKIRQFRGLVFATVEVNGEVVVASKRVTFDNNLFGYGNLMRRYGALIMRQKFDTPITDVKSYNNSVYLEYMPYPRGE